MHKVIEKIRHQVVENKLTQAAIRFAKRNSLPGFSGVSIFDVVSFIFLEAQRDRMNTRSNAMAFSFFISLFPFLIVVFSLLNFLPIAGFRAEIQMNLSKVLPEEAESYVLDVVNTVLDTVLLDNSGGLLSIGIIFSLYFASNGMLTMMRGFDKSYEIAFNKRNYLQKRSIALMLTILVGLFLVSSILGIVTGKVIINSIGNILGLTSGIRTAIQIMRWLFIITLIYTVISSLYRFGASLIEKHGYFSPGATLATVLAIIVSILFSYFVNNFGKYNQFYGSLAALIILLLWIRINCFILLVGFELNASIAVNRNLLRERED